jgi:3-keto-5-aminohexanoate cleavage enzyme
MATELPPLIITATPNKSWLNPDQPYPEDIDAVAAEAQRCHANGASIIHLHSITEWVPMIQAVRASSGGALVQCGMSSLLLDERLDIYAQHADMISIIASHHAEAFPEGNFDVLHPVAELIRYCELCTEWDVRPEFEIWHSGSIWNLEYLLTHTELVRPVINTLFFGWPGGTWSPPTIEEYLSRRRLMPAGCAVTVSVMGPERAGVLAAAITSGDHVRVGTEDYAFNRWGEPAQASDLVAEVAALAEALGRPVARPEQARDMLAFPPAS